MTKTKRMTTKMTTKMMMKEPIPKNLEKPQLLTTMRPTQPKEVQQTFSAGLVLSLQPAEAVGVMTD